MRLLCGVWVNMWAGLNDAVWGGISEVQDFYFLFLSLLFLLACIVPLWALFLAYFKIEKIKVNLKRSSLAISVGEDIGWDPISRSWAIRGVVGAFAFPAQSIKHGVLSAEDYAEFPMTLKVTLRCLGVCLVVSVLGIFISLAIGDLTGWVDVDWF